VLLLLNWPITETVTLDKEQKTITLRRKFLLKSTEYKTSLDGAKGLKMERYKKRVRFSLSFADGMCFRLSTSFFPAKLLEGSISSEIRSFLGFKQKKMKSPSVSRPPKPDDHVSTSNGQETNDRANIGEEQDSDSDWSDSSIDEKEVPYDSDGRLNWDKAIEDWESDVKERKAIH
jgi:hypothetical protein